MNKISQIICTGVSLILFARPSFSQSFPPHHDFLKEASKHWEELIKNQKQKPIQVGQTAYLDIAQLIRGQDEISILNIQEKLNEKTNNGDVKWESGQWILSHNDGKSSVPLNDPILVIKGPQGYLVTDGHHDLFLSLYLDAKTIAAVVKEDLSHLKPIDFWKYAEEKHYTYLKHSPQQLALKVPEMMQVVDNPNRYFAALIAMKVAADEAPGGWSVKAMKCASEPIWIKLNNSLPFIEFKIAKILKDAGIEYQAAWGKNIPSDILEKARSALKAAKNRGDFSGILIVENQSIGEQLKNSKNDMESFLKSPCSYRYGQIKSL